MLVNPPLACREFDQELKIIYVKMALEIINVLDPFLAFVIIFNLTITHNMCALQIDIHFEDLQCVT
jgi:hypothetical protein